MLSRLIQLSLRFRHLVIVAATALFVLGGYLASELPIDVLPSLTRPRVVVITECPGMAPEEVELRVTIPLEYALNGASDVVEVRSTSDIGLSVVYVEFDWGQEIYQARQIVQERLTTASDQLPESIQPQLAPVASLLGQIMLIGIWSEDGTTGPLELRTQADWVVAQRLRALPGVAQVITMGGGRKQVQVLVDLHGMHRHEVSLADIERALRDANLNVTGGFVEDGAQELLVRGLGLVADPSTLGKVVVRPGRRRSVLLEQVARITEGAQLKRGDSSVNGRRAVVLTVQKQPGADTRALSDDILRALDELRPAMPEDVTIHPTYLQRQFIDHGIANVIAAIRGGALLVLLVLLGFMLNLRTTMITVLAIPMSMAITAVVFDRFSLGINVMTLGGLAVGLGMLVDDAIVGVENAYRRLGSRLRDGGGDSASQIIYEATIEVLGAIVISTLLVVIVFLPLFLLTGMEGRLFTPLAIAYLVSISASTLVALTLVPALSLVLLPGLVKRTAEQREGAVLRAAKRLAAPAIRASLHPLGMRVLVTATVALVLVAALLSQQMKRDFLPAFDEGATQVNLYAAAGTSLETMTRISRMADQRFQRLLRSPDQPAAPLADFTCKLGRAEQDEHIMGVHVAEYVLSLNPQAEITRQQMIELLNEAVADLPGVEHEIEQPIAHLISHMLTGVAAQIAIKVHGDDLDVLRRIAEDIRQRIGPLPGLADPIVEQQTIIPQLRFEIDYDALADYGVAARELTDLIETAMHGRVVSLYVEGGRFFDVVLRMDDEYRLDLEQLDRLPLELPDGTRLNLGSLVKLQRGGGPNTIHRESNRRRIVVRVNTRGGDLSGVVENIQRVVGSQVDLPAGYYVTYGGQFEARRSAQQRLLGFSLVSAALVFAVLYCVFPQTRLVLQVLVAVPIAMSGGVAALIITGQSLSVAAMVGFISLGGIATRNGILLISTYQRLIQQRGWGAETVLEGSLQRVAPVLMSALTTGLGLLPLVIGGTQPGKEILYPIATVIVGGLVSSTLCEFLVRPGLYWHTRSGQRAEAETAAPA